MSAKEVHQGRLRTPFYSRLAALDTLNTWHNWKGYTVPDALYCADTEYFAIRNATAVFDLSPMTKYRITGPDALVYIDRLVTRDMRKIAPGRVAYAVWCNDQGQVIDDGTIFHLKEGEYRLCSQERHCAWLMDSAIGLDVSIVDETADVAALAVQGPTSFAILSRMGIKGLGELKPFGLMHVDFDGFELTVSRTGFTGDLGYELWTAPENAETLWDYLFAAGEITGIRAIGTDALEHARIEAGYIAAYIDFLPAHATMRTGRTRSPLELGLDWLVDLEKGHFNGRRALLEAHSKGVQRKLVGLDIDWNKQADGALIYSGKNAEQQIGEVTSALWSPTLKQNIALAFIDAPWFEGKQEMWAEIYLHRECQWERKMFKCRVTRKPFYSPERKRLTPPNDM